MQDITIRKLSRKEISGAIPFVWDVFNQYDAPDRSQAGVDEFYNIIYDEKNLKSAECVWCI